MATTIDASDFLTYQAAAKKNAGEPTNLDGAMAKYYSSEVAVKVSTACKYGGYGYTKIFLWKRFYRL